MHTSSVAMRWGRAGACFVLHAVFAHRGSPVTATMKTKTRRTRAQHQANCVRSSTVTDRSCAKLRGLRGGRREVLQRPLCWTDWARYLS